MTVTEVKIETYKFYETNPLILSLESAHSA